MFTTFLFELREEWLNLFLFLFIIKSGFAKEEKGAWEAMVQSHQKGRLPFAP